MYRIPRTGKPKGLAGLLTVNERGRIPPEPPDLKSSGGFENLFFSEYDSAYQPAPAAIGQPQGFFFSPDGTSVYSCDNGWPSTLNRTIFQYPLSTPWDLSTVGATATASLIVNSEMSNLWDVFFAPDGKTMYVAGDNDIYQYTLTTGWALSSASYASKTFDVSAEGTYAKALWMSASGGKLYVSMTGGTDGVHQYSLYSPWDVSTAAYDSVFVAVKGPSGLFFDETGLEMYVNEYDSANFVNEFGCRMHILTTPWNIATASETGWGVAYYDDSLAPIAGLFINPDRTKLYATSQDASRKIGVFDLGGESTASDKWKDLFLPDAPGDVTQWSPAASIERKMYDGFQCYNAPTLTFSSTFQKALQTMTKLEVWFAPSFSDGPSTPGDYNTMRVSLGNIGTAIIACDYSDDLYTDPMESSYTLWGTRTAKTDTLICLELVDNGTDLDVKIKLKDGTVVNSYTVTGKNLSDATNLLVLGETKYFGSPYARVTMFRMFGRYQNVV